MFKHVQIFLRIWSFQHGEKNKLSEHFRARFWESVLCLKRNVLYEFSQKCFKTTERHSLAICGSFWGEKQFLLIFVPFYWFDQKKFFKQIQIFHRSCLFQTWLEKQISEYFSACFGDCHLMSKKKVLNEFPQKFFKTRERQFRSTWLTFAEFFF